MEAKGWKGGTSGKTLGVRVGTKNAARHFSKGWDRVHIETDGVVGSYPLGDGFWKSCPEFRGGGIQKWLLQTGLAPWPKGSPPKLELISCGGPFFRLTAGKPAEKREAPTGSCQR